MSDKVTVRPLRFIPHPDGVHEPNGKPFQVDRTRAAEMRANGLVEYMDEKPGKSPVPRTGHILQHDDGRPNDEPPPESDSPTPGEGVPARVEYKPPVPEGSTNPEPKAESDSPPPGTGDVVPTGPHMIVENPQSLVPATEGIVERRTHAPEAPHHRAKPAAATPITEDTASAKESPAPKRMQKVKDR